MMEEQRAEEQFLEGLDREDIPVEALLELLETLAGEGRERMADAWAEMLIETLSGRKDGPGVLRTLEVQAGWTPASDAFSRRCRAALRDVFRDRLSVAKLDAAGVGVLPAKEALRRFRLLLECRPGVFCREKTWGAGRIRDLDEFYKKITIDFMRRPGHALTFEYAAETLEVLPETHILARACSDGPAVRASAAGDPAGTVVEVLRDMGPMSVDSLETFFEENDIVSPSDWKKFWNKARTVLQEEDRVVIPSRKNERLRLRDPEASHADRNAFSDLAEMRDPVEIFKKARLLLDGGASPEGAEREILLDRMKFALVGVRTSDPALYARLAALAFKHGLEALDITALRKDHRDAERLITASRKIPARERADFCDFLRAGTSDSRWLLELLPRLPLAMVEEVTQRFARDPEHRELLNRRLRDWLNAVEPPLTLIVWASRHVDAVEEAGVISGGDLLVQAVAGIEKAGSGEDLRMQNLIRKAFDNPAWLKRTLRGMTDLQRRGLFERVQSSGGWDSTSRRGVMAEMIKLYPELETHAAAVPDAHEKPKRVTSWRSYRERQAQLKKLVEEEIPANSREIGEARGYGDLRENFEYHAARHQQGLLMRRRAELDKELAEVAGADFADIPCDKVAPGVTVLLQPPEDPSAPPRRLTILGEWDRDEALGIVSCRSRVGEQLIGAVKGRRVDLPEGPMVVTDILPLGPEIKAWIQGNRDGKDRA